MSGLRDELTKALHRCPCVVRPYPYGDKHRDDCPRKGKVSAKVDAILPIVTRHIEQARAEALRSLGADLLAKAREAGDYKWATAAGQLEQMLAEVPATEALRAEPTDAEVEAGARALYLTQPGDRDALSRLWDQESAGTREAFEDDTRAVLTAARQVTP